MHGNKIGTYPAHTYFGFFAEFQKQMQAITEQLQLVEARRAKLDGAGSKQ